MNMRGAASSQPLEVPDTWEPCSDRSRERDDPLAGTAGYGAHWMLVEVDGPWGEHAFLESRIDGDIGRAIAQRAEAAGLRPVAIRQFGLRADERRARVGHRWAIADARLGRTSMHWGFVEDPAELLEIPLDGSAGESTTEHAYLVCTHAQHDRCCAVRGRPVAKAFAEADPAHTWECSHLGGDRFAATMIILPEGLCYGRVAKDNVPEILTATRAGRIIPEHFRGRSSLPNIVQAAQTFARQVLGEYRIDALPPSDHDIGEPRHRLESPAVVSVDLQHSNQVVRVHLRAEWSPPLMSTCKAQIAGPVRIFAPQSLELIP